GDFTNVYSTPDGYNQPYNWTINDPSGYTFAYSYPLNVGGNPDWPTPPPGYYAYAPMLASGPAPDMGYVSQTLATTPGATYQLSFYLANDTTGYPGPAGA